MRAQPIAVVQGADGAVIQRVLADVLTASWRPRRIAGVIEIPLRDDSGVCGAHILESVSDGARYPIFQELGAGSTACALDPAGVVDACAAVCADIAAGCDLVLLSKFGKLEAESGSGLLAAFAAAMEAGIPVLTAVSPRNQARWDAFAAPYYEIIAPRLEAVGAWLAAYSSATASSASR